MFSRNKNRWGRLIPKLSTLLKMVLVGFILTAPFLGLNQKQAQGAPSATMNFQARLLNSTGSIVSDGNYHVEFKLYNVSTGGSALWTETRTTGNLVTVKSGYLSVYLGSVTAFPGTIDWNEEHWLTMNIGGSGGSASWDGEMSPRIKLTAVPYAFQANVLAKSSGANRGTLSFGSVTNNPQITLPNDSGEVCLDSGNCGYGNGDILNGGQNGPITIGTNNNTSFYLETNNVNRIEIQGDGDVAFDTNTLFVDAVNNRVGVGNAAPAVALDVTGDAIVSDRMQIGPVGNTINQCNVYLIATETCDIALEIINTSTESTVITKGLSIGTEISAAALNTRDNIGIESFIALNGTQNYSGNNISVLGAGISSTSGTVSGLTGVYGTAAIIGSGTVGEARALHAQINAISGSITNAYGVLVEDAQGSIQTNYGIRVQNQTAGATDIGIYVQGADDYALWVDDGTTRLDGVLELGVLGTASNDTVVCRNSSNLLATCNSTFLTNTTGFIQNGNNFGANAVLGTNDNFSLAFETNNTTRLTIDTSGNATLTGNLTVQGTGTSSFAGALTVDGNTTLGNANTDTLTITGTAVTLPNSLNFDSDTLYIDAANNRVGMGIAAPDERLHIVGNIKAVGSMALGNGTTGAVSAGTALRVIHTIDGATDPLSCVFGCYAMAMDTTIDNSNNALTGIGVGMYTKVSTAARAFTLTQATGLAVNSTSLGAGSTITNNYGIKVENQTAGTNDYGIYVAGADTYALWVDSGTTRLDGTLDAQSGDITNTVGALSVTSATTNAVTLDSGTTGAVNVGTGANAKTVTVGNSTGATSVVVNCGTGACSFGANATAHATTVGSSTGASATTLQAGTGGLSITTQGTGALNIGNNAVAQTINIGNGTGATTVSVLCGTGVCGFGNNATDHATTVGSATGASATTIQAGTSGIMLAGKTVARATADGANTFELQNSNGATLFGLDSTQSGNVAVNSGAEVNITGWTAHGTATVTRTTTAGEYASGSGGARAAITSQANAGMRNNLGAALTTNSTYIISFSARSSTSMSDLTVAYYRTNATLDGTCSSYSSQAIDNTGFKKISCVITTSGTAGNTTAQLAIYQVASATRNIFIDNLSIVRQNNTGTQNNGVIRIGGSTSQGLTLLTLDTYAGTPFTGANAALAGSMYFDTSQGKIQCYDGVSWGACGAAPDNIITLSPEYQNAVLNGTGIGTMTADFCSGTSGVNINDGTSGQPSICSSSQTFNFYKWTSPQATPQTYSVWVTYQLPSTFKNFVSGSVSLTGRTDSANSTVRYTVYRNAGGTLTACGSVTTVSTGVQSNWQVVNPGTDPSTCSFAANNSIVFKIEVIASSNANAYVSNLGFQFANQ